MPKKGQPAYRRLKSGKGSSLERDLQILKERMPKALGGDGMTREEVAEKHDMQPRNVSKILKRPDVMAVHKRWQDWAMDKMRALGPLALESTTALLQQHDPYTTNQFWKRMGIDSSPQVGIDIEELNINAPPEVLEMVRKLVGGDDDDGGTPPVPAAQS